MKPPTAIRGPWREPAATFRRFQSKLPGGDLPLCATAIVVNSTWSRRHFLHRAANSSLMIAGSTDRTNGHVSKTAHSLSLSFRRTGSLSLLRLILGKAVRLFEKRAILEGEPIGERGDRAHAGHLSEPLRLGVFAFGDALKLAIPRSEFRGGRSSTRSNGANRSTGRFAAARE